MCGAVWGSVTPWGCVGPCWAVWGFVALCGAVLGSVGPCGAGARYLCGSRQVKELGVAMHNCSCAAQDVRKVFEAYWLLGAANASIPAPWPANFSTAFNMDAPMRLRINGSPAALYFSVRSAWRPPDPLFGGPSFPQYGSPPSFPLFGSPQPHYLAAPTLIWLHR